jgi:bifunctional non-homologous end joining protein LigD
MTDTPEKSVHLWSTKAGADKVYDLYLRPKADGWVVDYANGKRGGRLQTGTRTAVPIAYDGALELFASIERSKIKEGYGPVDSGQAYTNSEFSDRSTGLDVQLLSSIDEATCLKLIESDDWVAQLKENGERRPLCVRDGVVTGANRSGLLVNIPAAWISEFAQFKNAIFDGEQVGDQYAVFDLLSLNGEDLKDYPFASRYLRLLRLLPAFEQPASMRLVEAQASVSTKMWLLRHVRENNLEGLVFKRATAKYCPGRSQDALKFKLTDSATCVVVRQNPQRSVVLGMLDEHGSLREQGNVTIPANHPIPDVNDLVEVSFLYYTGQAFEQPVYCGKRSDLVLADARIDQITRRKPGVTKELACA